MMRPKALNVRNVFTRRHSLPTKKGYHKLCEVAKFTVIPNK